MAGLPHYKNSRAAMKNEEPLYLNQFELVLTPPAGVANGELLLEQVKKIGGLELDKNPGVVSQFYKFAERRYAGAKPDKTTIDLTVDFEVNLNDANQMYTYKTLRAWSDLIYDPLTGSMGLKKNYAGAGLLTIFNKDGEIYRKVRFPVMYPMAPLNAMELDYSSTDIYTVSGLVFSCDFWEDVIK